MRVKFQVRSLEHGLERRPDFVDALVGFVLDPALKIVDSNVHHVRSVVHLTTTIFLFFHNIQMQDVRGVLRAKKNLPKEVFLVFAIFKLLTSLSHLKYLKPWLCNTSRGGSLSGFKN